MNVDFSFSFSSFRLTIRFLFILFFLLCFSFSSISSPALFSSSHSLSPSSFLSSSPVIPTSSSSTRLHVDFSSFLGGNSSDQGNSLAVDHSGNVFIAGTTYSPNFPVKNAFQSSYGGAGDGFVAEFNSTHSLIFSTFLGGSGSDTVSAIAVDGSGNCYVVGTTLSSNFPVNYTFNSTFTNGFGATFLVKFNPFGSLIFSTITTHASSYGNAALAVDSAGNIFVSGTTGIYKSGGTSATYSAEAHLLKFNSSGSLVFSKLFGGSYSDTAVGIALDSSDNIFLTGYTDSTDFPFKNAKFFSSLTGNNDIFLVKFNSSGSLLFSEAFGGFNNDKPQSLVVDRFGNIFITGSTESNYFPLKNAYDSAPGVGFLSKFNSQGGLVFSTYIPIVGYTLTTDSQGFCYVAGSQNSDSLILKFGNTGNLVFRADLGSNYGFIFSIFVLNSSELFITGSVFYSFSSYKGFQSIYGGGDTDAFIEQFSFQSPILSFISAQYILIFLTFVLILVIVLIFIYFYFKYKRFVKISKHKTKIIPSFYSFMKFSILKHFGYNKQPDSLSNDIFELLDEIENEFKSDNQ